MIPGVSLLSAVERSAHVDARRELNEIFNNRDGTGFSAQQAKMITMSKTAALGGNTGHWHDYDEMYLLVQGSATWTLQPAKGSASERMEVLMQPGDTLFIPGEVAHKVMVTAGSILIGFTAKPYLSSAQDTPFEFED